MAPHDTNPKKEVRRHAGPLIGISVVLVLVLVALVWWLSGVFSGPNPSEPSSTVEAPAASPSSVSAGHAADTRWRSLASASGAGSQAATW